YHLGKYEEAIKCYDKAIEINPKHYKFYCNKGVALDELGKYEEAIACYDKAIEINPQCYEAYFNKGNAYYHLGKYKETIGRSDEAIKYYNKAIECYDEAIRINPKCYEAHLNKGNVYYHLGKYEETIGRSNEAINYYNKAIECYDEAIKINPQCHEAYSNKDRVLDDLGKHKEATKCSDEANRIKKELLAEKKMPPPQTLGKNIGKLLISVVISNLLKVDPHSKLLKILRDKSISAKKLIAIFKGKNDKMLLTDEELKQKYGEFINILYNNVPEGYILKGVKVSKKPALIQKDAWSLATIEVNSKTKEITLYIHEAFLEASRTRGPPEEYTVEKFLQLLIQHELDEYQAVVVDKTHTTESFHEYLQSIDDSPQLKLFEFAEKNIGIVPGSPPNPVALGTALVQKAISPIPVKASNIPPLINQDYQWLRDTAPELFGKTIVHVSPGFKPSPDFLDIFSDQEMRIRVANAHQTGGLEPLVTEELVKLTDMGMNALGVTLLYKYAQMQKNDGTIELREVDYTEAIQKGRLVYLGNIVVPIEGKDEIVKVWAAPFDTETGKKTVILYLDHPEITTEIYPSLEIRERQMLLLGRGTLAVIKEIMEGRPEFKDILIKLGLPFSQIEPAIVQMNEALSGFAHPKIVDDVFKDDNVLNSLVYGFTTHTPVEAGLQKLPLEWSGKIRLNPELYQYGIIRDGQIDITKIA
ncbi:MAG: tetratricopeptide repeat protein, partial [Elusimicrobiota bacterium]|nr:tetratricopeptide repeat protein [Elusimicrobiota bacterium]